MASQKIAAIALFVFVAIMCTVHVSHAFDLGEYIHGKIQKTIREEKITCANYEEFCTKSNEQFQTSGKIGEDNSMAIEFCKVILKLHVCLEENEVS